MPEITSGKDKELLNLETDFLEIWNSFWWIDVKWDVKCQCTRWGNEKYTDVGIGEKYAPT